MQDFLTVTGELETFDAALCDAVTGRSDSAELLEQIRSANLFLVELDGDGHWYRLSPPVRRVPPRPPPRQLPEAGEDHPPLGGRCVR